MIVLARLLAIIDTRWYKVIKALMDLKSLVKGGAVAAALGTGEGAWEGAAW